MIYCIESCDADPYRNLALEQFVFDKLDRNNDYFMLWQNHNAIIVGRHQNTQEEVNAAFVKEKSIAVVRRLSGGGAVYHDLGNLNFTFITGADKNKGIDFSVFCQPIREALCFMGIPVEISGRNDMSVDEKKISGNAQYIKKGRVMHHGTILYDSDLGMLSQALKPGSDKIESRGIKSLRSRVTNIRPYMKTDMPVSDFRTALKDYMISAFQMREFTLNSAHNAGVEELKEKVYTQWSWNYGSSPPYTMRKERRFDGCGKIEILLDVGQEGKIKNIAFYGDFFGNLDPSELGDNLIGHHLKYDELISVFSGIDISQYFHALKIEDFLALVLE
ncbi:MAG: lipoate--protein ligase [Treponema sp.]|jgi:lipoate-protein ligase A|nr:lipoate--protein ligase [Treponema sp.]